MSKIWDYGFTTSGKEEAEHFDRGLLGQVVEDRSAGKMHGFVVIVCCMALPPKYVLGSRVYNYADDTF